jgi:hypothetical protein
MRCPASATPMLRMKAALPIVYQNQGRGLPLGYPCFL